MQPAARIHERLIDAANAGAVRGAGLGPRDQDIRRAGGPPGGRERSAEDRPSGAGLLLHLPSRNSSSNEKGAADRHPDQQRGRVLEPVPQRRGQGPNRRLGVRPRVPGERAGAAPPGASGGAAPAARPVRAHRQRLERVVVDRVRGAVGVRGDEGGARGHDAVLEPRARRPRHRQRREPRPRLGRHVRRGGREVLAHQPALRRRGPAGAVRRHRGRRQALGRRRLPPFRRPGEGADG